MIFALPSNEFAPSLRFALPYVVFLAPSFHTSGTMIAVCFISPVKEDTHMRTHTQTRTQKTTHLREYTLTHRDEVQLRPLTFLANHLASEEGDGAGRRVGRAMQLLAMMATSEEYVCYTRVCVNEAPFLSLVHEPVSEVGHSLLTPHHILHMSLLTQQPNPQNFFCSPLKHNKASLAREKEQTNKKEKQINASVFFP